MSQKHTIRRWAIFLLLATLIPALAACSRSDQLLLAEYNRDGEAEIFLAELGADEAEWQSLAQDVQRNFIFEGELAMFVPDSDRILIWYQDGNDVRIEQMQIGDEAPTELLEADADDRLFARFDTDPFAVYVTESQDFVSYRCYVSLAGAKAARLTRSEFCFMNQNGVVELGIDQDDGTTVTLISLDGEEETVILAEVDEVGARVRYNEALTQFAYVVANRTDAQLFLIEPGAEEGEPVGDEFAVIDSFGFLGDGETVYVIGKPDEADDELGLFINATGEALMEADDMRFISHSESGDYAVFMAQSGNDEIAFSYSLDDNVVTELLEGPTISWEGAATADFFLLKIEDDDESALYSVREDGSEVVELLATDAYDILSLYLNVAAKQLLVQLRDADNNDAIYVTSLDAEDGYFLLEEWHLLTILNASAEQFIFWGREDAADDVALFSIPWAEDAAEVTLDDTADFGYYNLYFARDGRSLYYTAIDNGFGDFEVRTVPVDGSERPDDLYRDTVLLDVSWDVEPNFQTVR